jgi:hypothetical protein
LPPIVAEVFIGGLPPVPGVMYLSLAVCANAAAAISNAVIVNLFMLVDYPCGRVYR